ncbi:N-acetyl-alpha-D-glucosaminyl L-malate synthase BshA [Alicyclobacillus acidoterrestris]|uniref:N-acetyl-alpha-D-glucosaminyl L-malate synthase BshA n=1 Tax=Alicyclobacillus acidoterrestris (strain ATCC 49025 / DSM 3922 / CIP 106132 / NCIMB 13137 / GD3B) TaxID=1356854 RepID=T0BZ45_ALIAG|nr:N-acetyl-alpha-D-glucosaminyl L-malate synthase BshA [Alicyclobacillus acidoterrestris]EPZ45675.1 N-acetyl-alpha-D-glucosaminyl L-malate synthase [Alicyclobacillus acidoterrestris ATCC 49025]UNO47347.1 N-acetyl-alpha-D-glucosaminyl L-malate synthase BshA [Alicyclobacillus acidoterrestris]
MRIGISCYPTIGGSGAVATELGKALAKRGHEVHFIVTDVPFRLGAFVEHVYIHELDTTTYPVLRTPPYDFSLAALMAKVADEYQLDVIHAHYALPFAVCGFLAREMAKRDVKVVTTLHGTDVTVLAQDTSLKEVIKLGIEKSDAVTAVSRSLIQQTRELFETDKPIECIYNFIDTSVFRPQVGEKVRSSLAKPQERVLLHVSNFRQIKRIPDVIEIFARVRAHVQARLLLVGEGPEYSGARQRVRELGLEPYVEFLGKQDEVATLIAAADVLLLPSAKESFGLVALEAMACGIPVIGSIAGGIPEVVVDGVTGFLSDVGDVTKMATDTLRLLQDDRLYNDFSQAARRHAESQFHVHDKVGEYEALYRRVCGI